MFGPFWGKAVSALYFWYFISLAALNSRDLGDFSEKTIMSETPLVALLALFIVVCAWAVYFGVEVVTRYSFAFTAASLFVAVISILLLLNMMDLNNFLPMLNEPWMRYVQGTHIMVTIPLGEVVCFLMIAPSVKDQARIGGALLKGVSLGIVTTLLVIFRDTAVLGNTVDFFATPSFETLRMVSITETVNRMEILFAIVFIILFFFKVSLLYYVSAITFAQIFKLDSYRHFVMILGVSIVSYAIFIYTTSTAHADSGKNLTPFLWLPFEIILPALTLILAKLRKIKPKEDKA